MKEKEKLKNTLRDRGLRATPKRLEMLTLIANYGSAIPYATIQKNFKNYDRVTLYRTIKTLVDSGIIHKASVNSDDIYYAMCKHHCSQSGHHHRHVHFKCTSCLKVSCLDVVAPVKIDIPKVVIQQVDIEVSGLCEKCV